MFRSKTIHHHYTVVEKQPAFATEAAVMAVNFMAITPEGRRALKKGATAAVGVAGGLIAAVCSLPIIFMILVSVKNSTKSTWECDPNGTFLAYTNDCLRIEPSWGLHFVLFGTLIGFLIVCPLAMWIVGRMARRRWSEHVAREELARWERPTANDVQLAYRYGDRSMVLGDDAA